MAQDQRGQWSPQPSGPQNIVLFGVSINVSYGPSPSNPISQHQSHPVPPPPSHSPSELPLSSPKSQTPAQPQELVGDDVTVTSIQKHDHSDDVEHPSPKEQTHSHRRRVMAKLSRTWDDLKARSRGHDTRYSLLGKELPVSPSARSPSRDSTSEGHSELSVQSSTPQLAPEPEPGSESGPKTHSDLGPAPPSPRVYVPYRPTQPPSSSAHKQTNLLQVPKNNTTKPLSKTPPRNKPAAPRPPFRLSQTLIPRPEIPTTQSLKAKARQHIPTYDNTAELDAFRRQTAHMSPRRISKKPLMANPVLRGASQLSTLPR